MSIHNIGFYEELENASGTVTKDKLPSKKSGLLQITV